jgi:hypothetical protein
MKVYEVHFSHQIEGGVEGTFSTLEKAKQYLIDRGVDPASENAVSGYIFFKTKSGLSYFIKEIGVQ